MFPFNILCYMLIFCCVLQMEHLSFHSMNYKMHSQLEKWVKNHFCCALLKYFFENSVNTLRIAVLLKWQQNLHIYCFGFFSPLL